MIEIRSMLVLSTGHVSDETRKILEGEAVKDWPVVGFNGVFGWVIYAHDDDDPDIPRDLWSVFEYARSKGCDYIMFDADADTIEELPVFEW